MSRARTREPGVGTFGAVRRAGLVVITRHGLPNVGTLSSEEARQLGVALIMASVPQAYAETIEQHAAAVRAQMDSLLDAARDRDPSRSLMCDP